MMKTLRTILAAAALAAAPAAAFADDAAAVAGLKAIAANPAAPVPAALEDYGFTEATYLMDKLTQNEVTRLRVHIDRRLIDLPGNIEGAIVARAQRPPGARNGGRG